MKSRLKLFNAPTGTNKFPSIFIDKLLNLKSVFPGLLNCLITVSLVIGLFSAIKCLSLMLQPSYD